MNLIKELTTGKKQIVVKKNIGIRSKEKIGYVGMPLKIRYVGCSDYMLYAKEKQILISGYNFRNESTLLEFIHKIVGNTVICNGWLDTKFEIKEVDNNE